MTTAREESADAQITEPDRPIDTTSSEVQGVSVSTNSPTTAVNVLIDFGTLLSNELWTMVFEKMGPKV